MNMERVRTRIGVMNDRSNERVLNRYRLRLKLIIFEIK